MATTVLLTGAFGNIGRETLKKLLAAGHSVVCLDRETDQTRQTANSYSGQIRVAWGDIADESVLATALEGVDCVVHLVGIIPPLSELQPELAERVNVGGTQALIAAMEHSGSVRRLIFASTNGVFGQIQDRVPPLLEDSPVSPDDVYGRTKVAAEDSIRASALDWTILRICAAPPVEMPESSVHDPGLMFEMSADGRIEFIHPNDVSTAFSNAVDCDEAIHKTLFLGGGKKCQFLVLEFANKLIKCSGISGELPAEAFKPSAIPQCFGDWVDTRESQRLLSYQHHDLDHYAEHIRKAMGWKYYLVSLISPLAKRALLKNSAYYRK